MDQSSIPLDVVEEIVEEVYQSGDTVSLKALALLNHTIRHLAQRRLFNKLVLICPNVVLTVTDLPSPGNARLLPRPTHLLPLLESNPDLATYVRSLDIVDQYGYRDDHCNGPYVGFELETTIRHFKRLESFSYDGDTACQFPRWSQLYPPNQRAIEMIIRLPTLRKVTLYGIDGVPSSIMSCLPRLQSLNLKCVDLIDPDHTIYHSQDITTISPPTFCLESLSILARHEMVIPGIDYLIRASLSQPNPTLKRLQLSLDPVSFEGPWLVQAAINRLIASQGASISSFHWIPCFPSLNESDPLDISPLIGLQNFVCVTQLCPNEGDWSRDLCHLLKQTARNLNPGTSNNIRMIVIHFFHLSGDYETMSSPRHTRGWSIVEDLLRGVAFSNLKTIKIIGPAWLILHQGEQGSIFLPVDKAFPTLRAKGVVVTKEVSKMFSPFHDTDDMDNYP